MAQSVYEQAGDQVADTVHKASRAATAIADALEDGAEAARRTVKQGCYAADELIEDTRRRVQKRPIQIVAATFAAGIAAGTAIGWIVRRMHRCNKTEGREGIQ